MNKIFVMALAAGLFLSCEEVVVTPDLKITVDVEKTTVLSEDGESELESASIIGIPSSTPSTISAVA